VELTASPVTLAEHLDLQLEMQDLTAAQRRIGRAIIGSLDDRGYLRESIESLSETTGESPHMVEEVLAVVQGFDPAGIAARDLKECLLAQLDPDEADGLPGEIVRMYLPQLGRGSIDDIARAVRKNRFCVEHAVSVIRRLCPSPGACFDTGPTAPSAIPDVFVRKVGDSWAVLANRDVTPSLNISREWKRLRELLAGDGAGDYARSKGERAQRLITDINQRRTTLTRVAKTIAREQAGFFERGKRSLKPLKLEDVAAAMGVNPSTVSRAIQGKYMSTPFGIFEFRFFFSGGFSMPGGDGLSATAVKERLKALVTGEDPEEPLSDRKLANALKAEGIRISRRTVAKYREDLGLPASWERKAPR
jgi:RNA polymerase sigma-54 factor